jgi:hypothetical protein
VDDGLSGEQSCRGEVGIMGELAETIKASCCNRERRAATKIRDLVAGRKKVRRFVNVFGDRVVGDQKTGRSDDERDEPFGVGYV